MNQKQLISSSGVPFKTLHSKIGQSRLEAIRFLQQMDDETGFFRLTKEAETSPYARCFHIFLAHLLKQPPSLEKKRLAEHIRKDLRELRKLSASNIFGKPFRQLLTFSLSALYLLEDLHNDPLDDLIKEQLKNTVRSELVRVGANEGHAGSGNQAMFLAIFLLHARDYLGLNTEIQIEKWVELHQRYMNRFGFWGNDTGMTHLQFQNGYHQHEILEYLGIENPKLSRTLIAVREMADSEGHFAPYPGGGGCYDYDAVFMLTPEGKIPDELTQKLLLKTAATIVSEQRQDGGFAESICVRPRNLTNLRKFTSHLLDAFGKGPVFPERLRYFLTLQRTKHDRIHTHWSRYSRRWNESDLWDTWFRMLTLARIDVALNPEHTSYWGFIDYPGIGYHPSLGIKKQAC